MLHLRPLTHSDVFIGGPDFIWHSEFGGRLDQRITVLQPRRRRHWSCLDVEPVTGKIMRYYLRYAWYSFIGPNPLFPEVARKMHFPMFWRQQSRVLQPVDAQRFEQGILSEFKQTIKLSQDGAMVGGITIGVGMLLVYMTLGRGFFPLAAGRRYKELLEQEAARRKALSKEMESKED